MPRLGRWKATGRVNEWRVASNDALYAGLKLKKVRRCLYMDIIGEYNKRFIAVLTQIEIDYLKNMPHPDATDAILDYEHVSQRGIDASENRNDCGAACIAVCARSNGHSGLTVDEVSAAYMRPNRAMTIPEVRHGLGGYGIANSYKRPLSIIDIALTIRKLNKPAIALVSYQALPYQSIDYHGSHYVVIYGMLASGVFLYHDPLSDGRLLRITAGELTRALQNVEDEGNMPNQGILLV